MFRFTIRYRLRTLMLGLTVLSLYLASYSAMMVPMGVVLENPPGYVAYSEPSYRFGNSVARIIYWPIALVDQLVRPDAWGPSHHR